MKKIYFVFSIFLILHFNIPAVAQIDSFNSKQDSLSSHSVIEYVQANDYRILKAPYTNFTKALEGQATGLMATNGSGQPGSIADLLIRGANNPFGSNQPLILLDGAPYFGDYNAINPNDIDNIRVLKDAATTMRYGSGSGNGVIAIQTKKGSKASGRQLNVDASAGIVTRGLSDYTILHSEKDYYEYSWDALRNQLINSGYSVSEAGAAASGQLPSGGGVVGLLGGYNSYNVPANALIDPNTGKLNPSATLRYSDGDWKKAVQRTAIRHEYHASFSDAGKKGDYYAGAGYLNEGGYIRHTGYERFNARFNGNLQPLPWLRAGLNLSGTSGTIQAIPAWANPFVSSRLIAPIYPVHYFDAYGNKVIDPLTGKDKYDWGDLLQLPSSSMGSRPSIPGSAPGTLEWDQNRAKTLNAQARPYIEVMLWKELKLSASLDYNYFRNSNSMLFGAYAAALAGTTGLSSEQKDIYKTQTWTQSLSWAHQAGDHHISLLAGRNAFRYDNSSKQTANTGPGNTPYTRTSSGLFKLTQYFATASYDYKDKYLLDLGFQHAGSSRFADSHHWSNYWAAGIGWKLSNENFLRDLNWLNLLELKASYGRQGNLYSPFPVPEGTYILYPNPALQADHTNHLDIGLESTLAGGRVEIRGNYFHRKSVDQIIPVYIPGPNPAFEPINGLDVVNKGIELQLYGEPVRKRDIVWHVGLNLTWLQNEITRMPDGYDTLGNGGQLLTKGISAYNFYLPESAGVDKSNGDELYYYDEAGQKLTTNNYSLAYAKGLAVQGSALPKIFGSLSNDLHYKRFSFSFLLTFAIGGKYYDQVYAELMSSTPGKNVSADMLDRWTLTNRDASLPRAEFSNTHIAQPSTRFLRNASYLNWRSCRVSYDISARQLQRFKLKSLKLYVAGDNLLLLASHKGMDPQATFTNAPGYVYSPARTLIFGINAGL